MGKTIQEWQREIHTLAVDKGWYQGRERQPLEHHMLIVSEIAEATEAVRSGSTSSYDLVALKPEGEAVELADAVIRIMDYFEYRGWNLELVMTLKHEYNQKRPFRHGGKTV